MKAITIYLILFLMPGLAFSLELKNAIGWDGGLSLRRSLNQKLYIGLILNGDINKYAGKETHNESGKYIEIDSSYSYKRHEKRDFFDYSIKPAVICGYNIFKYKQIGLDLFGRLGYTYSWRKDNDSSYYKDDQSHSIHNVSFSTGISPNITFLERLVFEYHLGIMVVYERINSSDYRNRDNSDYHTYSSERDYSTRRYYFDFIGRNFSLDMSFILHFMF